MSSGTDSYSCAPCPAGQYNSQNGSETCELCPPGFATGGATGLTACIPCDDFDNSNARYYTDVSGSAYCSKCKCPAKNTKSCDDITGECVCLNGLYYPDAKSANGGKMCTKKQDLGTSYALGFLFFFFVLFILVPLVFCSGRIPRVSARLRHKVQIALEEMRKQTTTSLTNRRIRERKREETVRRTSLAKADGGANDRRKEAVKRLCLLLFLMAASFFFLFLGHFAKLAINVYLVLQSVTPPRRIERKLRRIQEAVSSVMISINIRWFAELWESLVNLFNVFNIGIHIDAGVTCQAAQAPVFLAMDYCIIALVVVLFDSTVYIFLRLSVRDFMYDGSRKVEYLVKSGLALVERGFKNSIQLLIGYMMVAEFYPFWELTTPICNTELPGAETTMQTFATLLNWFVFPFVINMLLNTFVYGEGPVYVLRDQMGKSGYYDKIDENDLFNHDPRFWHTTSRVKDFFVHTLAGGDMWLGLDKYTNVMLWKLKLLVKMTLGWWDSELLEAMEVKDQCERFDINEDDDDTQHEQMLNALGEAHSLFWQFIPGCVAIAKAGEAFNASPIFVFDPTTERALLNGEWTVVESVHPYPPGLHTYQHVSAARPSDMPKSEKEGMLVWFEARTIVGKKRTAWDSLVDTVLLALGINKRNQDHVVVYESEESRDAFNATVENPYLRRDPLERRYGRHHYTGVPGNSFPSEKEPLFVPDLTCIVHFHSEASSSGDIWGWRLCAVYVAEPPVLLRRSRSKRKLYWASYVLQFLLMLILCLDASEGALAVWMLATFPLVLHEVLDGVQDPIILKPNWDDLSELFFDLDTHFFKGVFRSCCGACGIQAPDLDLGLSGHTDDVGDVAAQGAANAKVKMPSSTLSSVRRGEKVLEGDLPRIGDAQFAEDEIQEFLDFQEYLAKIQAEEAAAAAQASEEAVKNSSKAASGKAKAARGGVLGVFGGKKKNRK